MSTFYNKKDNTIIQDTNIIKSLFINEKESKFIDEYIIDGNATRAVIEAGYHTAAPGRYAADLLRKPKIQREMKKRMEELDSKRTASATEILQFYTSVMRGQVLDQFGIEASLDTRIRAANELAKHQIELPMKLEQKKVSNNSGTIQLNFIPRPPDIIEIKQD